MSRNMKLISPVLLLALLFSTACSENDKGVESAVKPIKQSTVFEATETPPKVSRFGEYEGYSEARFSEWVRESQYITMRDGTRLAIDIIRPAVDGVAVDEPLPVIWTHSRYHRNWDVAARHMLEITGRAKAGEAPAPDPDLQEGVISFVDDRPTLQRLVKHGYVFVGVGVRGSGASFGRYEGLFSPAETQDASDIMDWLAAQTWSDGNLGMWGASYLGITQYMAASTGHPALKAIMPNVALLDMYDALYTGGIYRKDMFDHWGLLTRNLDRNFVATPVDEDPDGELREQAIAEHAANWDVNEQFEAAPLRDHNSESFAWAKFGPTAVLDEINQSDVAIYHWGGWYDLFAMDTAMWVEIFEGPDKLGMGPWPHAAYTKSVGAERGRIEAAEHHRWYDYWLKGIDNGIMDEPVINYAVTDVPGESWQWHEADHWQPKAVEMQTLYLDDGPSGSISSVNDGVLSSAAPTDTAVHEYQVDPATTTGTASRWDNAVGQGKMVYPDMAANDLRALTYTTPLLDADLTVVGHPVITLYVASTATDGDFYALLEEVDADGFVHYISEGMLRASHRAEVEPPWNNLGLPWQRSFAADLQPLVPGETVALRFDLLPLAHLFNRGHRLRVTVMGADKDNTEASPAAGASFRLFVGGQQPSLIELPVLMD